MTCTTCEPTAIWACTVAVRVSATSDAEIAKPALRVGRNADILW
jgi:hypothetical protein